VWGDGDAVFATPFRTGRFGQAPTGGKGEKRGTMAVVKVTELLAESEEGWEDAARQAVAEASKTLRGIRSVYVSELQATVENDKVKSFRANVKMSFVLERDKP
jgi:dodecin